MNNSISCEKKRTFLAVYMFLVGHALRLLKDFYLQYILRYWLLARGASVFLY